MREPVGGEAVTAERWTGSSVGASVEAEGQSGRSATGPDKDALLRQMACSLSLLDEAGNVLMATQDASPTLGYDTLVHINARHLIHPDDVARYEELRAAVLVAPDTEVDCQLRMLHAEGHYEVIECTARNLLHDERVGGILVTTRNVSRPSSLGEVGSGSRSCRKRGAIG